MRPKIFLMLLFVSCQGPTKLNDEEKKEIINEVRVTLNNCYNEIRKSGSIAELKYLDDSPDFFWVPPGYNSAISYDSVSEILYKNSSSIKSIDNSFDTLRIIPLEKGLATYTARIRSVITDMKGNKPEILMLETGIMIKRGAKWKLLSGQTSLVN